MGSIEPSDTQKPPVEYLAWLEKLKAVASANTDTQWVLGDLLAEGQIEFDPQNVVGDIPSHLLISRAADADGARHSIKFSNFWKDCARETGFAVGTLKKCTTVALFWPKEDRIKELTFAHHSHATGYDRAKEYLQACLVKGDRPHTVDWLDKHIAKCAGEKVIEEDGKYIRMPVSPERLGKLKQVAKYYRVKVPELMAKSFNRAIDELMEELARKISLAKYGSYEPGEWPFYQDPPHIKKAKDAEKKTRRTARMTNNRVQRERLKQTAISIRKIRRNELLA